MADSSVDIAGIDSGQRDLRGRALYGVVDPQEGHGVRRFPALIDQRTRMLGWFERHMPA